MFELPSRDDIVEVVITEECVEDKSAPILIMEPDTQRKEA